MMPRQALFVFPANNSLVQALFAVVGKEITNVGIVFKLPAYFRFIPFFLFDDFMVSLYRFAVSLSLVCFQPLLKRHVKRKTLPYFFLEKSPVLLGKNDILFYLRFIGN